RPGRQGAHRELAVRLDHLERLTPDGSGRPEQGDSSLAHARRLTAGVFRHDYALPKARIAKYAAGAAHSSESSRSSIPPCRPTTRPESFPWRWRFTADSKRSPRTAAMAITRPRRSDCGMVRNSSRSL